MHRFYAAETCVPEGAPATLPEEDARHAAQVLRLRAGDEAELFLGGARYRARALEISPRRAAFTLLERLPDTEPALWVTLFQGLPKGDKLETVIQKSVELGVKEIVPVAFSRCVARVDARDVPRKRERWQKIAREACKQSGRAFFPEVGAPISTAELCGRLRDFEASAVPWEEARGRGLTAFHRTHPAARRVAVVVGPEGGIAPEEIAALAAAGCEPVTLGPRILRTETAPLAALAALMTLYGEMDGTRETEEKNG